MTSITLMVIGGAAVRAVVDDPVLAQHAAEIRRLGKPVKENIVAIGQHRGALREEVGGITIPLAVAWRRR
jgi:hypothetical protein